MVLTYNKDLKMNINSDVEIVRADKKKGHAALLLRLNVNFMFENSIDSYTRNKGNVSFYSLVQIVNKKVVDTVFSEDNLNEFWLEIKEIYPEETIEAILSRIKEYFDLFLTNKFKLRKGV